MNELADMVRFSIRPQADGWRWETVDMAGRRRAGGVVRSRAIAAAMVIRDICAAQTRAGDDHLISAKAA
ncbi:hypothetical protein [Caulobacter hibisci]|uniref:Uncharacterized protein n=1 Tax=Caulobacter hibisci TaxID=2035993 RepID=A0ABS0SWW5_9CAUL|nr:hypothetical protein [Caulobacter hibisci]MBI1684130.1 hypothetical protein [Caulobacter hibisci]